MPDQLSDFDICAVTAALILFVGYHLHLYYIKPHCLGGQLPYALNKINAEIWLLKHKEKANESPVVLLAIQTIRNTMMAAVFVGGNALIIAYDLSNHYAEISDARLKVRSLVITAFMFMSFLCWANVIRLGSLVGYFLGTLQFGEKLRTDAIARARERNAAIAAADQNSTFASQGQHYNGFNMLMSTEESIGSGNDDFPDPDFQFTPESIPDIYRECSTMMEMMTIFFSFGFRLMFVSIPFAFFAAGPAALLVTSFGMWFFLITYDHVRHKDHKQHKL